ncbi:hypothetical protein EDB85DRAFT_2160727 [Lactarius pseudohatsudake]|nr:hypothetical protein EDB85DRAFT_2160727 [Lactarius pseudohatsudake]
MSSSFPASLSLSSLPSRVNQCQFDGAVVIRVAATRDPSLARRPRSPPKSRTARLFNNHHLGPRTNEDSTATPLLPFPLSSPQLSVTLLTHALSSTYNVSTDDQRKNQAPQNHAHLHPPRQAEKTTKPKQTTKNQK